MYSRVRVACPRSDVLVSRRSESTLPPAGCVLVTEVTPATVADLRVPGVNTGLTASNGSQTQAGGLPVTFSASSLNISGVAGDQVRHSLVQHCCDPRFIRHD